jgi:hypothetical protein
MTERKPKMNIQQLDSPYKSAKALQTIRYSSVNSYNKKQLERTPSQSEFSNDLETLTSKIIKPKRKLKVETNTYH